MANITTIFFDVGGVLLNDGWNHISRKNAADEFGLNFEELENKHAPLADDLDTGKLSVNEYIDKAIFYQPRKFSKSDFYQFMKEQSVAKEDSIALAATLAAQKKYLMATINNESTDLNNFRIEKFKLAPYFSAFFSSCFMGLKKPDQAIFDRVLSITQKKAPETVFIDDRENNLVAPRSLRMNTIRFESVQQVTKELAELGVII
ncbi:MAG: HAD-IA family hydrolase [Cyanobacteria bacterium SZAS LIN-3]|nr:HAD-IA family hydrolase [Cyanobacteria bacterium SZAS LIN-3]